MIVPAVLSLLVFCIFVPQVHATITPMLSLVPTGNGDSVTVNVTADPSQSVELLYTQIGGGSQVTFLGDTDSNGSFSTVVSSSGYGIVSGASVSVAISSINGPHSNTVSWPTVTSTTTISLSQTNVNVSVGQSSVITATNSTGATLYVSSNSNPTVANISINGTQVTVTGSAYGSTTASICPFTGTTTCSNIYVTVQNSTAQGLSFSQNNLELSLNQITDVAIYGGSTPTYYISSNTNPGSVQASVTDQTLVLTGLSSGASSIVVCASSGECGTMTITTDYTGNTTLALSQTNVSLIAGQNTTLSISGNGSYYVSNNSIPSVATVTINGNTALVTALAAGTDSVSICQSGGVCAYLSVSVSGNTSVVSGQAVLLGFGVSSESLASGQNASVAITGGMGSYYIGYNSNPSAVSALISGSALSLTGLQTNSVSIVVVCSNANSCGALPVIVGTVVSTAQPAVTTIVSPTHDGYVFTTYLAIGSNGNEVIELQKRLTASGYFTSPITGYFGPLTEHALRLFQGANGMAQVGYVGPITRGILNR